VRLTIYSRCFVSKLPLFPRTIQRTMLENFLRFRILCFAIGILSYSSVFPIMCVKKNRLVVSLYNACTASTLYLYSVTKGPTRLQHQACNGL
jgi:hypothetical protein